MLRDPAAYPTKLPHPLGSTTSCASHFAPAGREALPPAGQELLFLRCPIPDCPRWRRQGVPGSWETPMPACPALQTPVEPKRQAISGRLGAAFRLNATASASTTAPISGLHHAAYELAVYASCATLAANTQDSLPAGGQPLPGGSDYPLGLTRRFQVVVPPSTSLLLPQA
jgi:hypothetical protein